MAPQSVVIVGGSIAGLLHGVRLKRQGIAVTILEQYPSSDRSSHQAGIALGPSLVEFLAEYDLTGREIAIPAHFNTFAWRTYPQVLNSKSPRKLTSWGLLCRILRANFDGLSSTAVPHPPAPREGDGSAKYQKGKRVTGLRYDKQNGVVAVQFVDVTSGEEGSISTDLVIGADGVHSTVRDLVKAPTTKEYSGYVAWRGTVPERQLSAQTVQYFSGRVVASLMKRSYMVVYIVPTADGDFRLGERLLNWVWYYNIAEGSDQMVSIFTNIHGDVHDNTVPSGLVQPDAWKRQLATFIAQMTTPVAELVTKTENPFVTKVNDVHCVKPRYYDGHVVLVVDALAAIRPHTALASEQAARHCLSISKVWGGEVAVKAWDREVMVYAKRMIFFSRVLGLLGQGTSFTFLESLLVYVWFLVKVKLGRV